MTVRENRCEDCRSVGLHCIGSACSLLNVTVNYCDRCGDELNDDDIYDVDGEELCSDCTLEIFRRG